MVRRSRNIVATMALLLLGAFAPCARAEKLEIRGRVLAEGGQPLADAELLLLPDPGMAQLAARQRAGEMEPAPAAHTRSAVDGSFRLLAPEAGFWWLVARHPRHLDTAAHLAPILHDREIGSIELPVRREVTVRVVAADGTPLTGVSVVASCVPNDWGDDHGSVRWLWAQSATTDPKGRVGFATTRGRKLVVAAFIDDAFGLARLDETMREATLEIDHGLIDARLLDTAERPLAGVPALLAAPFLDFGTSDRQGKLRLPELAPDASLLLLRGVAFEAPLAGSPASAQDATSSRDAQTLHLPTAERYDLEVVDAISREPVAGAFAWSYAGHQRADARGWLRLELPATELRNLKVAAPGYLEATVGDSQRPASDREPIRVALLPEVALSGRVLTTDGAPLAGAEVSIEKSSGSFDGVHKLDPGQLRMSPRPATTDGQGRFRVRDLAPGVDLDLQVRRAGFAPHRLELPALEPAVETPPVEIVLDEHGEPIVGAALTLVPQPTTGDDARIEQRALVHHATTDAAGRFVFDDLGPGSATLVAQDAGFAELKVPGLEIAATDAPTDLGTLVLDRGFALEGVVVDPEGHPLAGARVEASGWRRTPTATLSSSDDLVQRVTTDTQGRFRFEALPGGTALNLSAYQEGFRPGGLSAVKPGLENHLRITLELSAPLLRAGRRQHGHPGARRRDRAPTALRPLEHFKAWLDQRRGPCQVLLAHAG